MIGVFPINGDLLRYHVNGKSMRCVNERCGAILKDWPDGAGVEPLCDKCGALMVRSQYLVDLGEWDGNGACGCEAYQFGKAREAESRMKLSESHRRYLIEIEPMRCAHIMRARRWLLDEMIRRMIVDKERGINKFNVAR